MEFSELKTDTALLTALEKAAAQSMTPAQVLEQRVSWIWGQLPATNKLTKEQIKQAVKDE